MMTEGETRYAILTDLINSEDGKIYINHRYSKWRYNPTIRKMIKKDFVYMKRSGLIFSLRGQKRLTELYLMDDGRTEHARLTRTLKKRIIV